MGDRKQRIQEVALKSRLTVSGWTNGEVVLIVPALNSTGMSKNGLLNRGRFADIH